jgi:hypothetical protein
MKAVLLAIAFIAVVPKSLAPAVLFALCAAAVLALFGRLPFATVESLVASPELALSADPRLAPFLDRRA